MDPMGLIWFIFAIAIIGLCLYLIETFIPMDPMFKTIIRVVVAIVALIWLLSWLLSWLAPMISGHTLFPSTRVPR